jgi:hypothetical protein
MRTTPARRSDGLRDYRWPDAPGVTPRASLRSARIEPARRARVTLRQPLGGKSPSPVGAVCTAYGEYVAVSSRTTLMPVSHGLRASSVGAGHAQADAKRTNLALFASSRGVCDTVVTAGGQRHDISAAPSGACVQGTLCWRGCDNAVCPPWPQVRRFRPAGGRASIVSS